MKLFGGVGRNTAPTLTTLPTRARSNQVVPVTGEPAYGCPVVAEIAAWQTTKIHDRLDIVYMPCRVRFSGNTNLLSGRVSQINIRSTTVGNKTCAVVPYLDAPGPQISLAGFCVCVTCLKNMPHGTPEECEATLNTLWQAAVGPVILTTSDSS